MRTENGSSGFLSLTITFSDHAEQKLTLRKIRRDEVIRFLTVVYRITGEDVKVITVYHTRKIEKLISSKLQRKAWRKIR